MSTDTTTDTLPIIGPVNASHLFAQAARDVAETREPDDGYVAYLDRSSIETCNYFTSRGQYEMADFMLTRSYSQALMGNEGE